MMCVNPSESHRDVENKILLEDCDYKLVKLLGKGTFGKVFLAVDQRTKELVAIKRSPKWSNMYPREAEMLQLMNKSNYLVSFKGIFYTTTEKGYYMQNLVFDYMLMSIGKYIRSLKDKSESVVVPKMNSHRRRNMIYQIACGLNDLHEKNIAHRDLKPDNILMNPESDYKVVICDLGSAKIVGEDVTSIPYICSRWYRAPELLCGSMNYTTAIDLWSFGCIIFELITLHPLFPGKLKTKEQSEECCQLINIMEILGSPDRKFYDDIKNKTSEHNLRCLSELCKLKVDPIDLRRALSGFLNNDEDELIDIMGGLLKWNPSQRTPIHEILKSKYFSKLSNAGRTERCKLVKSNKEYMN